MTLRRPWLQSGSVWSHLREIVANLKHVVEIPMGYEDETGFHFGAEPAVRGMHWPQA